MIRRTRVQSFKQYNQKEIELWNDFRANIDGHFSECDPDAVKAVKNILQEIDNKNIPNLTIPAVYSGSNFDKIYIYWSFYNSTFYFYVEKELVITEETSYYTVTIEWFFRDHAANLTDGGNYTTDNQEMWNYLSSIQFFAPSITPLVKL